MLENKTNKKESSNGLTNEVKKGLTLIEVVIYVAILAVLSVLVINTILLMFSAFTKARVVREISSDGEVALERIVREVRLATSINSGLSTFGTDSSHLALNTVRSPMDSTSVVKEIYVSGGRLVLQEDSGPLEYLTSPNSVIVSFLVFSILTNRSEAVKITLTLERERGSEQFSRSFFNTIILRGSY